MIDQRGLKVAVTLPSRGEREVLNELPFEIALFGHWYDHIGSSDRPTVDKMRCHWEVPWIAFGSTAINPS